MRPPGNSGSAMARCQACGESTRATLTKRNSASGRSARCSAVAVKPSLAAKEVARAFPTGDERLVGLRRHLERVDEGHGLRRRHGLLPRVVVAGGGGGLGAKGACGAG